MSKRPVTLLDVAHAAQVSRATASLVVRNSPVVAEKTRLAVEQAMQDLGYIYNRAAAKLRSARSGVVGMILPNISNPFFSEFLEGIEEGLTGSQHTVFLAISRNDIKQETMALNRLLEQGCDGIVICPVEGRTAESNLRLSEVRVPVVQALRHVSDRLDYVGPDYMQAIDHSIEHLVTLGHKHIAYIHEGLRHSAANERLTGLAAARRKWKLPEILLLEIPPDDNDVLALDRALYAACAKHVTAAICFNDIIAMRVTSLLARQGIAVGPSFSIIGFDGTELSRMFHPRLTSLHTYPKLAGREAAEQLVRRMAAPAQPVSVRRLQTSLQTGLTTGQAPDNSPIFRLLE